MHTKDYILGMHFIYINNFAIDICAMNKVLQALKDDQNSNKDDRNSNKND